MSDVVKKTILLVEDDPALVRTETKLLEREGYRIIAIDCGEAAVDFVRERGEIIDLILMDIDLGEGIDGTEAARRILKYNDIPVLFLSSHTEKEIVEKTEKITSYGYVVKNSGIVVLGASIKMAFKLFEARRDIQTQKMKIQALYEQMQAANDGLEITNCDLIKKMNELKRFHRLTVDRELIMIELKKEVNGLLKEAGRNEKYAIASAALKNKYNAGEDGTLIENIQNIENKALNK